MTSSHRIGVTVKVPQMNRSTRGRWSALAATCVALALTTMAASVGAQPVGRFQHETFKDFEKQLNAGQIHDATFNKKAHTLHLTLNDGRRMLVSYPSHEASQVDAQLRAKGVPVTVEKRKKPVAKAIHHTLRYIAGGIVVIVIGVVVAVLLVDRRRKLDQAATDQSSPGARTPPTGDPE